VRRTAVQWGGVALASIPSGLLFGVLLLRAVPEKIAIGLASAFGLALVVPFWIWVEKRFAISLVECAITTNSTVVQIQGEFPALSTTAFATSVLVVCFYVNSIQASSQRTTSNISTQVVKIRG
jgi:hypothetical protein